MDYHRLGLGRASSIVRSVRIVDWGATVIVDCVYDPTGEARHYQLSFQGCSQSRIDVMPDAPVHESQADLIGICLGHDRRRGPAILTTDLFELHVSYDQFQCIQREKTVALVAQNS
jgi:hypothetical protein